MKGVSSSAIPIAPETPTLTTQENPRRLSPAAVFSSKTGAVGDDPMLGDRLSPLQVILTAFRVWQVAD